MKNLKPKKGNILNAGCFLIPCIKSRDYPAFLCKKDSPAQPHQELMPRNTQPGGRKAQVTPTKPAQHHMGTRVNIHGPENHLQRNWFLLKGAWQAGQTNTAWVSVQNSLYLWIQLVLSKNATSQLLSSTGQCWMHLSWLPLCTPSPSGFSPSPEGLLVILPSAIIAPRDSTTLEIKQPDNREVTKQKSPNWTKQRKCKEMHSQIHP